MRKYAGASLVVLGILLSALGVDSGKSIHSYRDRPFTGGSMDWPLLIGGILFVTVGLFLTSCRRKSRA